MGSVEDAYAALLDDPGDPERRLVYADALLEAGDPRGEILALRHRLDRLPPDHPERPKLFARLAEIHLPPSGEGAIFFEIGGIPAHAEFDADGFIAQADTVARRIPLASAAIRLSRSADLRRLAGHPRFLALRIARLSASSEPFQEFYAPPASLDLPRTLWIHLGDVGLDERDLATLLDGTVGKSAELLIFSADDRAPPDPLVAALSRRRSLLSLRALTFAGFRWAEASLDRLLSCPFASSVDAICLHRAAFAPGSALALERPRSARMLSLLSVHPASPHAPDRGAPGEDLRVEPADPDDLAHDDLDRVALSLGLPTQYDPL